MSHVSPHPGVRHAHHRTSTCTIHVYTAPSHDGPFMLADRRPPEGCLFLSRANVLLVHLILPRSPLNMPSIFTVFTRLFFYLFCLSLFCILRFTSPCSALCTIRVYFFGHIRASPTQFVSAPVPSLYGPVIYLSYTHAIRHHIHYLSLAVCATRTRR